MLDGLLGAAIEWAGETDPGQDEQQLLDRTARAVADRLNNLGQHPAIIPFGGSSATGAYGYRLAAAEIVTQLEHVDHVVTAVGSGGTMAGLVAELGHRRVLGVHAGAVDDPEDRVGALLRDMGIGIEPGQLRLRLDQVGDGYSTLTPAAAKALTTAARTHGVILDPIYSARALAGLAAAVADGEIGGRRGPRRRSTSEAISTHAAKRPTRAVAYGQIRSRRRRTGHPGSLFLGPLLVFLRDQRAG